MISFTICYVSRTSFIDERSLLIQCMSTILIKKPFINININRTISDKGLLLEHFTNNLPLGLKSIAFISHTVSEYI